MSNKFLTVIYDMSRPGMQQKAPLLLLEADWTASGWSHAFADRDEARKELYRLQESIAAAPQVKYITDFGADPSGKTDSSAAVQAAVDSMGKISSPQVVADDLAYTAEEAREQFMDQVRHLVGHWERESRASTEKEKLEGLAFSIMNIFDGTSGLPAFDIVCAPHPDDKQYHIDEGSKYFVPGMIINECHLHEMLFADRAALAATPVQAQEPFAYMIVDDEGKPLFERGSMASSKAELEAELEGLNSHDYEWPFVIIPVFRAPVQPVAMPDGEEDFYSHACEVLEQGQKERAKRGVEIGTQGSLCDGISWLFGHLEKLESAAPAVQGDAKGLTDADFKKGELGWRPKCCDGGGAFSNCCDYGGCAANHERAAIAAKAAS